MHLILGVDRLETLCDVVANWDQMMMRINKNEEEVTVRGDFQFTNTLNAQLLRETRVEDETFQILQRKSCVGYHSLLLEESNINFIFHAIHFKAEPAGHDGELIVPE